MESVVVHSLSEHLQRVNSLCRLCGARTKRRMKDKNIAMKSCAQYASAIYVFHNVNVLEDQEGKHSTTMCVKCYTRLMRLKRSSQPSTGTEDNASKHSQKSEHIWCEFDPSVFLDQCVVCSHFELQSKGGRPNKITPGAAKRKFDAVNGLPDVVSEVGCGKCQVRCLGFSA